MANELVYIGTPAQTGLTVTAQVFNARTGAALGSTVSTTETATPGVYLGDMPTPAAQARYGVRFFSAGSTFLGQETIYWTGSAVLDPDESISSLPTATENANALLASTINTGADVSTVQGYLLRLVARGENILSDNWTSDANGFATGFRLRLFPTAALAAAATSGGSGEGRLSLRPSQALKTG